LHIYEKTDYKEGEVAATDKRNSITIKPRNLEIFVVEFNILTTEEGMNIANVLPQITGSIPRGLLHQTDIEFLMAITPDKLAGMSKRHN